MPIKIESDVAMPPSRSKQTTYPEAILFSDIPPSRPPTTDLASNENRLTLPDDSDSDSSGDEGEPVTATPLHLGGGFHVRQGLPRSRQKHFTLRELMILLDTPNGIDLNPEYQRGFVWSDERQIGLIDSLFTGWHIPGIIFNKRVNTVLGVRNEIMVCIDGKQRLTSVQRFTQGLIPCLDANGKKWWFQQNEATTTRGRKYLSQQAKDQFWGKKLLCDIYVGMTDEQEHELFERVQRGNPLTPAEKCQAKRGPWQQLARAFHTDYPWAMNCKSFFDQIACTVSKTPADPYLVSKNERAAGFDKVISSFVQILEGRKAAIDDMNVPFKGVIGTAAKYMDQYQCTQELKQSLEKVFDRFEELARLNVRAFANDGLSKNAVLAPIEFISVAYMIDQYGEKSNTQLEHAIRAMRFKVRQVHSHNVRRKQEVFDTLLESMQASLGDRGEKRARPDTEDDQEYRSVRQSFGLS